MFYFILSVYPPKMLFWAFFLVTAMAERRPWSPRRPPGLPLRSPRRLMTGQRVSKEGFAEMVAVAALQMPNNNK